MRSTNTTTRCIMVGAAALAAVSLPATAMAAGVEITAQGPVIELSVTESVESAPDTATFGTGVTTKAPTAQQALRENAQKMNALIRQIKSLGIADKDIQTSGININAEYDYRNNEEPRLTGYRASNQVQIQVRDMDDLGETIDALVAAGANNLNGPRFSLTDDNAAKAEARKRALERGKAQALYYAKLSGYNDVRVLLVSERISNSGPMKPQLASASLRSESDSTPVEPGQVGTSVNIDITYEMVR